MKCVHCDKDAVGRGLCRRHYQQAWKDGNLPDYQSDVRGPHTVKKRLLSKYKVNEATGCWEWTGQKKKDKFAYGLIWIGDRNYRAHRVSYEIHKGPIPEGLDILHSCDNPPCINPDHLSVGTRGENCQDAASRDRFPLNEKHHNTKLSAQDVIDIRANPGNLTQKEAGKLYGVSSGTISRIKNFKRRAKADRG